MASLQFFPQPGNRNIELFAVLGYGSPGDVVASLLEQLRQPFIAEGLFLVLIFNQVAEDLFYLPGGNLFTGIGGKRFTEKEF